MFCSHSHNCFLCCTFFLIIVITFFSLHSFISFSMLKFLFYSYFKLFLFSFSSSYSYSSSSYHCCCSTFLPSSSSYFSFVSLLHLPCFISFLPRVSFPANLLSGGMKTRKASNQLTCLPLFFLLPAYPLKRTAQVGRKQKKNEYYCGVRLVRSDEIRLD